MKIVITGGHLTPALAVIDEIISAGVNNQGRTYDLHFIGRKYPYEGENTLSWEYGVITGRNLPFSDLPAGKLHRRFSIQALKSFLKILPGFLKAVFLINRLKPDIVLSFGGYLAVPVCLAAWRRHIPIITHEQTFIPGLANRIISKFATKICLSYPDEGHVFPPHKSILTGNPVRKSIFRQNKPPDISIGDPDKVIYVTGGNLGSHALNSVIKMTLPNLLNDFTVIHQCGDSRTYRDYESLRQFQATLDGAQKSKYFVRKYFNDEEIGYILNRADIIVSRSGANTVSELMALGKPAVLIPLPWSGGGEQDKNARYLQNRGTAVILPQKDLSPETLLNSIHKINGSYQDYLDRALKLKSTADLSSAEKILDIINETVQKKSR